MVGFGSEYLVYGWPFVHFARASDEHAMRMLVSQENPIYAEGLEYHSKEFNPSHEWAWSYLRNPLGPSRWFTEELVYNALIWLAIFSAWGIGMEALRRKRRSFYQPSLLDFMVLVVLVSSVLGYLSWIRYSSHQKCVAKRTLREEFGVDLQTATRNGDDIPTWISHLTWNADFWTTSIKHPDGDEESWSVFPRIGSADFHGHTEEYRQEHRSQFDLKSLIRRFKKIGLVELNSGDALLLDGLMAIDQSKVTQLKLGLVSENELLDWQKLPTEIDLSGFTSLHTLTINAQDLQLCDLETLTLPKLGKLNLRSGPIDDRIAKWISRQKQLFGVSSRVPIDRWDEIRHFFPDATINKSRKGIRWDRN